jgi:hypothetical protein
VDDIQAEEVDLLNELGLDLYVGRHYDYPGRSPRVSEHVCTRSAIRSCI